ncbi:MAG: site-2 protease family protein [Candidatus Bipolaricaulota bacterium]
MIILLLALLPAAIVHEYSHGYVAWKLGDPTAKQSGRLTLNPVPHIDPVGTVLVPLGLILIQLLFGGGLFIIGWAKPVPIDPRYFQDKERGMLQVGLAGPLSNLLMMSLAAVLGRLLVPLYVNFFLGRNGGFFFQFTQNGLRTLIYFFGVFVIINIILALFNLIPMPPLDGSRILSYFLSYRGKQIMARMEQYGFLIILAFLWLGGDLFFWVIQRIWTLVLGQNWINLIAAGGML